MKHEAQSVFAEREMAVVVPAGQHKFDQIIWPEFSSLRTFVMI